MNTKNYDWSQFTRKINIKASLETIYQAWTVQDNIEKWFLAKAAFKTSNGVLRERHQPIEEGDTFEWTWHGVNVIEKGKVLTANGKDRIKFTFYDCMVEVVLKTEAGENIVELTQSEIPINPESMVNQHVGCTVGWTFSLTNLKSILEGGLDLRHKNKDLIDPINT